MFRLAYLYLVVVLALPSWMGAYIINTVVLEKEMPDGSPRRVVLWGDRHSFDTEDIEQIDALNEIIKRLNGAQTSNGLAGNRFGICDEKDVCSSYPLPVTVLLENSKRQYEDLSDSDWELHRCLLSLFSGHSFSKDDRNGLLTFINKSPYQQGKPSYNLDTKKLRDKRGRQIRKNLPLWPYGETGENKYVEVGRFAAGSVIGKLGELDERTERNSSLVIEPIDSRMALVQQFLLLACRAWLYRELSVYDKPASKIFGTCASMSLTVVDIVDAAIEELKRGVQQSNLLSAVIQSHASQGEIDEFTTKTSAVIDWLSALRNLLNAVPVLRDSTIFQLENTIKNRLDQIPHEDAGENLLSKGMFFRIFPECEPIKDSMNELLNEIDVLDHVDVVKNQKNIFFISGMWWLDAEIIHRILSSNDSQLIFVVAGDVHVRQCALLLENEGYEVLQATKDPSFVNDYPLMDVFFARSVDGDTLKGALDSRSGLRERIEDEVKKLVRIERSIVMPDGTVKREWREEGWEKEWKPFPEDEESTEEKKSTKPTYLS